MHYWKAVQRVVGGAGVVDCYYAASVGFLGYYSCHYSHGADIAGVVVGNAGNDHGASSKEVAGIDSLPCCAVPVGQGGTSAPQVAAAAAAAANDGVAERLVEHSYLH